jgi:hypothetical protein
MTGAGMAALLASTVNRVVWRRSAVENFICVLILKAY